MSNRERDELIAYYRSYAELLDSLRELVDVCVLVDDSEIREVAKRIALNHLTP